MRALSCIAASTLHSLDRPCQRIRCPGFSQVDSWTERILRTGRTKCLEHPEPQQASCQAHPAGWPCLNRCEQLLLAILQASRGVCAATTARYQASALLKVFSSVSAQEIWGCADLRPKLTLRSAMHPHCMRVFWALMLLLTAAVTATEGDTAISVLFTDPLGSIVSDAMDRRHASVTEYSWATPSSA